VGWNNEGWTTAYAGQSYSYGPICYDYTPPQTGISIFKEPRLPLGSSYDVTVTLSPTDPYSGVAGTYYYLYFSTTQPSMQGYYNGPIRLTMKSLGAAQIYFYSWDKAGNTENFRVATF
jgi:hypothetical protein